MYYNIVFMSETDCLVLYLNDNYIQVFVIFDGIKEMFYICGKKIQNATIQWVPFSFYCKTKLITDDFIHNLMEDTVNIHLYNFNNLPLNCTDISFSLLHNSKHVSCELLCVENEDIQFFDTVNYLKLLENVNNNFEE